MARENKKTSEYLSSTKGTFGKQIEIPEDGKRRSCVCIRSRNPCGRQ